VLAFRAIPFIASPLMLPDVIVTVLPPLGAVSPLKGVRFAPDVSMEITVPLAEVRVVPLAMILVTLLPAVPEKETDPFHTAEELPKLQLL
jgi:hypothetical protein